MTPIIRPIRPADISAIKSVIREAWDWLDLVQDEQALVAAIALYLHQVLYIGTFGWVAVYNEKVIGVIVGAADGKEPICRMLAEDITLYVMTLLSASEADRINISTYFSTVAHVYEHLMSDAANNYDGTLDFLVLSKEARGLGIGKQLWLTLLDYFTQNNISSVYLYTDTECNFGFYEHLGFTRKVEQAVSIEFFDGYVFDTTMFLYECQI